MFKRAKVDRRGASSFISSHTESKATGHQNISLARGQKWDKYPVSEIGYGEGSAPNPRTNQDGLYSVILRWIRTDAAKLYTSAIIGKLLQSLLNFAVLLAMRLASVCHVIVFRSISYLPTRSCFRGTNFYIPSSFLHEVKTALRTYDNEALNMDLVHSWVFVGGWL